MQVYGTVFVTCFWYKVSCFSWILDFQFIEMFIYWSKQRFSQGSVLTFLGILVSYGEKIGYIGILLHPPEN